MDHRDPRQLLEALKAGELDSRGLRKALGSDQLAGADLPGVDLSQLDLSGLNLERANLQGANLEGAKLFRANLAGATLNQATLTDAELSGADLTGAELIGASAERAGFGQATLIGAQLFEAHLEHATLSLADLQGADLRHAVLRNARLREANLRDADATGADFRSAELSHCDVHGATFRQADLRNAGLRELRGYDAAAWIGVDVRNVNFAGAYLLRRHIADENYLEEFRSRGRWSGAVYQIWRLTSDCGRSMSRWCLLILIQVLLFAWLFTLVDINYGPNETWLSPLYYSIVTLTSLGYGDVVPRSVGGQVVAMAEVVVGYVMLGGLISIFSNRIARRAD
jgi:uncharacterized protein YjbI with pentapeptide repeats